MFKSTYLVIKITAFKPSISSHGLTNSTSAEAPRGILVGGARLLRAI